MHQTTLAMHTTALAITQKNKIERTLTLTNSTNHNKIATNFKLGDLIRWSHNGRTLAAAQKQRKKRTEKPQTAS